MRNCSGSPQQATGATSSRILRATARTEIAVYRDVSKAVIAHLGRTLRWSRLKSAILASGIDAVYLYERLGGWHRMVTLQRSPSAPEPAGGRPPPPTRASWVRIVAEDRS